MTRWMLPGIAVIAFAKAARAPLAPDRDAIFAWAGRHGVNESAVEVQAFPKRGGELYVRGLGATREIEEGEAILSVPGRLWLASDRAPSIEACKELWEGWDGYRNEQLVLQLLLERSLGETSAWHEWIAYLPSLADFAEFLPYAAKDVSKEFQALPIIGAHKSWRRSLKELRDYVVAFREDGCFPAGTPWPDDFLWADCVVSTRSFVTYSDDGTPRKAFVPLIDLGNSPDTTSDAHPSESYANARWQLDDGVATMTATRSIQRGEEITQAYGDSWSGSPEFILDTWGFIQESSLEDVELLPAETCSLLEPVIKKYIVENTCTGKRAACSLARIARLSCPSRDDL